MQENMILMILNIVFGAIILFGFLFGLKGAKKSAVRLACFIVFAVISIFVTPLVTKYLINMNFTYNGEIISVNSYIMSLLENNATVGSLIQNSTTFSSFVENIPVMVCNIFVFVVVFLILNFVSFIIYLIIASIFCKTKKGEDGKPKKKYRLVGGVIGAAQAAFFAFFVFLPVSGFVSMLNDIKGAVSASETIEYSSVGQLMDSFIPEEVNSIIDEYSSSAVAKFSGAMKLDDVFFDNIACVTINSNVIKLRSEIVNISKAYDEAAFIFSIKGIEDFKNVDFQKLSSAANYLFDSEILKQLLPELIQLGCDQVLEMDTVKNDANLTEFVEAIYNKVNDDKVTSNIINEINAIVGTVKTISNSKLIDVIPADFKFSKQTLDEIVDELSFNNNKLLYEIVDNMFNSKLLNTTILFGLNYGTDELENLFANYFDNQTIHFNSIDYTDDSNYVTTAQIKSLFASVLNVYNNVKDVDLNTVKNDFRTILDLDTKAIVLNIGDFMNVLSKMDAFSQTGIYSEIVNVLNNSSLNKYIDFEIFNIENIWTTETGHIANFIESFKQSDLIQFVNKTGNSYSLDISNINAVIDVLNTKSIAEGEKQKSTYFAQLLGSLFNLQTADRAVDLVGDYINDFIIGNNSDIAPLNLKYLNDFNKQESIITMFDKLLDFGSTIDIDKLRSDPLSTVLGCDLEALGGVLDVIKDNCLFANTLVEENSIIKEKQGTFNSFMAYLQDTSYSRYVDFEIAKSDDLSFKKEFANIQTAINELQDTTIIDNGTEYSLIEFILRDGNFDVIFDQVSSEKVKSLFEPLFDCKLLSPLVKMVADQIGTQIQNIVKDSVGDVEITIPEDLTEEQVEVVLEVVTTATEIIKDFTQDDFNVDEYVKNTENIDAVANLLTTLQEDSKNSETVFGDAYDAFVKYVDDSTNIEGLLNADGSVNKDIDWTDILTQYAKNI